MKGKIMRHKTKTAAIHAAKHDYAASRFGESHRVGWSGVTYTAERDGVYRHERNDDGGTRGVACPTRRIAK